MLADQVFAELHARHLDATNRRDMAGIEAVSRGYDELLNQSPDAIDVVFASATAHMQCGRNGVAIALFEKALRIREVPEIWNNLGTAHKAENRNAEAEECWRKALALREDADYYNNMATLYINSGEPQKGLPWAERGLQLDPGHPRLHWNHALMLLEMGRWREGFQEYEWGIKSADRPNRFFSANPDDVPMWDGSSGKRVVIYGEQGIGDEIMYSSCIPDAMRRADVIFECHPRLLATFERSFGVKCYGTRKDDAINWAGNERIDARLPMASLFRLFRGNGKFPREAYIKPNPELVELYRAKLRETGGGPYIGIGWKAGSKHTRGDLRSIKLKSFLPLMEHGGTFISLQYTDDALGKVERFKEESGFTVHHWPDVVETGPSEDHRYTGYNYDHTIALIAALDLVIVPNTTAVHVCGAIGKECWTITPDAPAWRYQLSGKRMPMYGDWVSQYRGAAAIERIAKDYQERLHHWSRPKPAVAARG